MDITTDRQQPRGIVVTGGGSGIGRATAQAFAAAGDEVLVVGRAAGPLNETAGANPRIHTLAVDLTDEGAPEQVVKAALSALGRIDVLVNNAGGASFDSLQDLGRAQVNQLVSLNLLAPLFLTQQALSALEETGGTVVNVTSAGAIGLRAMPGSSLYAATKVGLDSLTRSWAVELAPRGIRVLAVAPGLIRTNVAVSAGMSQDSYDGFLAGMAERIPRGRVGAPEDVAWWVVAITDPGAGYASGLTLAVDGGLSIT